jgi:hypothetical protein
MFHHRTGEGNLSLARLDHSGSGVGSTDPTVAVGVGVEVAVVLGLGVVVGVGVGVCVGVSVAGRVGVSVGRAVVGVLVNVGV